MMRRARLSLFARSLLLMVGLILASQAANLLLFRALVQQPRLERFADYVRAHTAAIDAALRLLPPERRAAYLRALEARGIPVRAHLPESPDSDAPRPALRWLLQPMARELGPRYALRWSLQGEQRLWVRPTPEGLSDWIGFPTRGLLPGLLHLLLLSSAASFVLALLGAWWMHRTIHRPMQALARAAEAVGRGRAPPALARRAPPEIAAVLDSFERMAASLEQAAQDRAVMLAGVSHDLRTPLAKLRLCVEMLRPEADAGLIATMERSILAADGIIGQFVDFARVGADEPQQTVDLAELVRSAIADVAADGPVAADLQRGCIATVRPLALRRLVTNLLDNARRHAGGEIDVELRCTAGGVSLAVLDRGPGIAPEQRQSLLEPFRRGPGSRGSGLGLAIAERIARLHGGSLSLDARPGGGLAARVRLPAALLAERPAA